MIRQSAIVISDFGGGQDTKTPLLAMPSSKSPNMRNWHCAGMKERLVVRGGYAKLNSGAIPSAGLDVAYPPGYQTTDYNLMDTATHTEISQGFKPSTSADVTKVRLWLKSEGTPAGTDTVHIEIQTDASGVPSGTPVANGTSDDVDISDTITSSYSWIEFTFTTNPVLVAGTQYHIVLVGDFNVDGTNYIKWGIDDYDVIYPNGSMSYYDGATWVVDTAYDAVFEVYITGGVLGNDGYALWDFNSKRMVMGIWGTTVYKMDKTNAGTPDGTWDALGGGSSWDSYTKLIVHWDGADAATAYTTEDDGARTVTFGGTAQLDTAQKKFGASSLLLDGNSDYVTIPDSDDWDFGEGDFTIDFWIRYASSTEGQVVIGQYVDANNRWYLMKDDATHKHKWIFVWIVGGVAKAAYTATSNWSPSDDTWYHIAFVRNGSNAYLFIDGVSTALTTLTTFGTLSSIGASALIIGRYGAGTLYVNGWIDELRVCKGVARWTANFTPPTSAYSKGTIDISYGRNWTFADWKSGRMLLNSDIGLYTYTGTGNLGTVGAAPIGRFMTIFKNYVFIAGLRGSPNEIRYSALNDYTTWASANSLTIHTNDGDIITGIRELRGRLYVFKRFSIHRVSYVGSNPTFQVDPIIGVGTPSHYSIKEIDMGGDVGTVLCFFTADKKLAVFNGYDLEYVNDTSIEKTNDLFQAADDQPIALSDCNMMYSDLFHAQVNKKTNEYILYVVLNTDTTIGYAFIFDYKTGGLFPYDNQPFASSAIVVSTNKEKLLYTAGYSGYAYLTESGNDDDGSDIRAYWVSGKFKPEALGLMSKGLLLGVRYKEAYSLTTANMSFQFRLDQNAAWTTAQNFAYNRADEYEFGKVSMFDVRTIHNMFQTKIVCDGSNPAPTLYGLELYGEPLGVNVKDRATA